MAFSLNKIMLIGNIGKDPETRFTTTNKSVTSFSIATTSSYKGKDGNYVNETEWHNIEAWELSDYVKENLKKGSKIYLEGKNKTEEYEKNGEKKRFTKVIADSFSIILLDKSGESKPEGNMPASQVPDKPDSMPEEDSENDPLF